MYKKEKNFVKCKNRKYNKSDKWAFVDTIYIHALNVLKVLFKNQFCCFESSWNECF